jgi:hypothetical protein
MTTVAALLRALANGRERESWEDAQALARGVVDDPKNALAKAVLDAGPLAMRRAEELAEAVLGVANELHRREDVEGRR